ncbi:unnamed protein product [Paramecium sonneborni]|uniref:Alpha-type protein kinase domain-containing protein n=1 Tax=Paramecium sonneborni TaxID=65129 RepID=A0A8S1RKJ5_9CILI|nr:unnamed protein product [Paramecium sonneborni]
MSNDQLDFFQICIDSIFCKSENCQLDHSRKYVGICIKFLRMEQKYNEQEQEFNLADCQIIGCKFYHFKEDKLNDQLQKSTINGVFPHNLCKQNCMSKDCRYLHRGWNNICLANYFTACKKCNRTHKKWVDLKKEVNNQSQLKDYTPEELDDDKNNPLFLDGYCIPFFKGECPKIRCIKNHIDWEDINLKIKQVNALQPCTVNQDKINQNKQLAPVSNNLELLCEESELIHYKKHFLEQNVIDILFIMDLTGSMQVWKNEVQCTITLIIQQFKNSINGYQIRVAFVGYRDVCDENDQIVYYAFTQKVEDIENFISKLETKGGGDEAEDIAAGFEQALKLNFSHHSDSLLCTFLIADAPCHGQDYHNIESDNEAYTKEKNYFEKILQKFRQIKKNNFLCCVKITDQTDIMFQKMKLVFPFITITTKKKPEELSELVTFSLRQSVQESKILKQQLKFDYYQVNFEKAKLDNFNDNYHNQEYWKNYKNIIDSMKSKGITGLKITKDINELNNQELKSKTIIFKAFDAINNREVILKIPKDVYNKEGEINDQEVKQAEKLAEIRFYSSTYACQMAYFFNQELQKGDLFNEMQPIFYAHPILYQFKKPFYGLKKIYGETFIQNQFQFEKYTTNFNYCDTQRYFYSTFSHFSFTVSQEILVITDLQGFNNIFTDPSIQTDKKWNSILNEDETNLKDKGILNFKEIQHKDCSYLCRKLKLVEFSNHSNINQSQCPKMSLYNLHGICNICDEFFELNLEKIKLVKEKKLQFQCDFCLSEQENQVCQNCECCYKNYKIIINQEIKRQTILGICDECQKICDTVNVKPNMCCYYCKKKCQRILKKQIINLQVIYLCQDAFEYINQIQCINCKQLYNKQDIISQDAYTNQSYICCQIITK